MIERLRSAVPVLCPVLLLGAPLAACAPAGTPGDTPWSALATAAGEGAPGTSAAATAAAQGEPNALDFVATDLAGRPFHAAELAGEIVLLDFWAVWCPPCIDAIPELNELEKELAPDGFRVVVLAVYSGTVEDVREFAAEHGMQYTVVVGDEDLVYEFQVVGYPTYVLVDRQGRIRKKYVGALADLAERVRRDVSEIDAETPAGAGDTGSARGVR